MTRHETAPRVEHDKVIAIVVVYHPDFKVLNQLIDTLTQQVAHTCVVDNSPAGEDAVSRWFELMRPSRSSLLKMGENRGIAAALNAGIAFARARKAHFVLLNDQDSQPACDMVRGLLTAMKAANAEKIAAVGPLFTDKHTHLTYPFQCKKPGKLFYQHTMPNAAHPIVETLSLITSGSLIAMAALEDVGDMREDFFIDHVDTEWCVRARARGWHLFGTNWATMRHDMGDQALRVWFLRWRSETAHSPERMYYRVRNFVRLFFTGGIEWRWKFRQAWFVVGDVYSQVIFGSARLFCFRMAVRGFWDGLRGHMGRLVTR